jgi:hypothetical protein
MGSDCGEEESEFNPAFAAGSDVLKKHGTAEKVAPSG